MKNDIVSNLENLKSANISSSDFAKEIFNILNDWNNDCWISLWKIKNLDSFVFDNKKFRLKFLEMLISMMKSKEAILRWSELKRSFLSDFEDKQDKDFREWLILGDISISKRFTPHSISNFLDKNDLIYFLQAICSLNFYIDNDRFNLEYRNVFSKEKLNLSDDLYLKYIRINYQSIDPDFFWWIIWEDLSSMKWTDLDIFIIRNLDKFRYAFSWAKPLFISSQSSYTYKCTILQSDIAKWKIVDFSKQKLYKDKRNYLSYRTAKVFDNIYEYLDHIRYVNSYSQNQILELRSIITELLNITVSLDLPDVDKEDIKKELEEMSFNLSKFSNYPMQKSYLDRFMKLWFSHNERLKKQLSWIKSDLHKRIWELSRIIYNSSNIDYELITICKSQELNLKNFWESLKFVSNNSRNNKTFIIKIISNYLKNSWNIPIRPFSTFQDYLIYLVWDNYEKMPDIVNKDYINKLVLFVNRAQARIEKIKEWLKQK